jgi:hypothetical protein
MRELLWETYATDQLHSVASPSAGFYAMRAPKSKRYEEEMLYGPVMAP